MYPYIIVNALVSYEMRRHKLTYDDDDDDDDDVTDPIAV